MSEAENIDKVTRRRTAEARLARSLPAREAAAAAHAGQIGLARKPVSSVPFTIGTEMLSPVEAKVLDAAGDILGSKGGDGRTLAEQIHRFIASHGGG